MAFVRLMCKAGELEKRKQELDQEKQFAMQKAKSEAQAKKSVKLRCRHRWLDCARRIRKFFRRRFAFPERSGIFRCCYKTRHEGSCENYTLKSVIGFTGGFLITYVFFMFFVFQLNFKFSTATIMCSIFGSILTIGLAFSYKVRCVVFLTLPQLFSKRGRQALLAYAFILAITGPAKNTLNNMGILSESLACGQEQLKAAVKQILEVIKKPFYAIRDAIRAVVKVVKMVVKKIKEILLAIKRVILAIVAVIKSVFEFLAKIVNVCNKELGTPFQRCTRVFESAITDCHAKLGPVFSWLCSITYLAQSVCYIVKFFDYVCILVDFISNSIVGVVVKKIRIFVRHIKTMFYVRIRFSHSFHFETNASKSLEDVATGIVTEIKERTEGLMKVFDFMSCATSLFFMFIIFRVLYYRYKFLTDERFDNRFITKDFRAIDMRRAQLGKETVLPLNQRERNMYISVGSCRLVKKEKLQLSQSAMVLGTASLKLATHMMADYALFWVLLQIRRHGSFQSTFTGSNIPTLNVKGEGLLADLLRSIVKAFQPVGLNLEIDTIPCLPDPIPPDYDRYVQIASLLVICWLLMIFEPFGLRWRHSVMCFYHPQRAKERSIWLYNHILRTRSSFLKFARRQLRRKFKGDPGIAKITCKEFVKANLIRYRVCRLCLSQDKQMYCLLCGEVFRDGDAVKPIRCQTPNCPGIYCEKCFQDLQNLCTVCLDPIQYGDLSDISEEKDSSDLESGRIIPSGSDDETNKVRRKKKLKLLWCCRKRRPPVTDDDDDDDESDTGRLLGTSSPTTISSPSASDSDYYSTDTDLSYSYQYRKDVTEKAAEPPRRVFVDIEKQRLPDYASMDAFRESSPEEQTTSDHKEKPKKKRGDIKKKIVPELSSESSEPPLDYDEESLEGIPLLDLRSLNDQTTTTTSSDVKGKGKKKTVRIQTGGPTVLDESQPKQSKRGYLLRRKFWRKKKKTAEKGGRKPLMKDASTSTETVTSEEETSDNETSTPSTDDIEMAVVKTAISEPVVESETDVVFIPTKEEEEESSETSTETSSETSVREELTTEILSRPSEDVTTTTPSATETPSIERDSPIKATRKSGLTKIPLIGQLGIKRKRRPAEESKKVKRESGGGTAGETFIEETKKVKRAIQKLLSHEEVSEEPTTTTETSLINETKKDKREKRRAIKKTEEISEETTTTTETSVINETKKGKREKKRAIKKPEEISEKTTTSTETPLIKESKNVKRAGQKPVHREETVTITETPLIEENKKNKRAVKKPLPEGDTSEDTITTTETPSTEEPKRVIKKPSPEEDISEETTTETLSFEESQEIQIGNGGVIKKIPSKEESPEETTTTTETPSTEVLEIEGVKQETLPEISEATTTSEIGDFKKTGKRGRVYFEESLPVEAPSIKRRTENLPPKPAERQGFMKGFLCRRKPPKPTQKSVDRRRNDLRKGKVSESTQTEGTWSDTSPERARKRYEKSTPTTSSTPTDASSEMKLGTKKTPKVQHISPKYHRDIEKKKGKKQDAGKTKRKHKGKRSNRKSLRRQRGKIDLLADLPDEDEEGEEKEARDSLRKRKKKKSKRPIKSDRNTQTIEANAKFAHVGELCAEIVKRREQIWGKKRDAKITCMNQTCPVKMKRGKVPKLNLDFPPGEGKPHHSSTASSRSSSSADSSTASSIASKTSLSVPSKRRDKKKRKTKKKKKKDLHRELSELDLSFAHEDQKPSYHRKYDVYYFTESETPRSVRSITFSPSPKFKKKTKPASPEPTSSTTSSSNTSVTILTSPNTQTLNSQSPITSPRYTVNYLYSDDFKESGHGKVVQRKNGRSQIDTFDSPGNTTGTDAKSYKIKARNYYSKLKTKRIDNPPAPGDHQSKFGQFIRRLLRKENSASAAPEQGKPEFVSSESESRSPSTRREEPPPKSKQRGTPASTNVFYNFLMGAGLTAQGKQNVGGEDEDEPFVFVNTPDRFGLYDSTDSEISELRYPIREHPVIKESPIGRPKRIVKEFHKEPISPVSKAPKEDEGFSVGSSFENPISRAPKEDKGFSVGSSFESPISRAPKEDKGFSVGSSFESPISRAPKEDKGFSVGGSFESKTSPISKHFNVDEGISVQGSFGSDLRAHEKLDATSTVISIDERFLPSRIISVGERPHPSRLIGAENNERDISRIISIENRFGASTITGESPGEEISSSKEESTASEESSSRNTASSGSTATSEENPETDYNRNPQIIYRVDVNSQKKSDQVGRKNTNAIVQQALIPKSSSDIYYTPESSATKELAQLKKDTKASPGGPKAEEVVKIKRADAVSQVPTAKEGRRVFEEEVQDEAPREEQIQEAIELEEKRSPSSPPVGRLNESARKRLSRLLESQMSDDRRRGSLGRQSTRYSRDPPERDQNYDDSLMKKNHQQQQQQPSELHQGPKPWCSCKNADDCRRLNHQQYSRKSCPERRRRTTYDLVKSAENLRQQNQEQGKTPCACPVKSKQGQKTQSSPEVSKNKQNMKSEDHADEYYSDYATEKNEGYGPNQMKQRKYPYEEPLQEYEYNNENHERNCACDHCNRRNRFRNCKCCNCTTRNDDDHVSSYSDDSQCNLNLAYQKNDDYPQLVDEIENSISRRNKERVKKTMRQFEMLSRQNKGLEKPIYDDDDEEDDNAANRYPCNKRTSPVYGNRPRSREAQYYNNQKPRPPCCCDRRNYQTKSECLSERPMFSATPFPRPRGFVEKVARYMDPSMPEAAQKYPRYRTEYPNGRWQMDPRSGEWVKVCDDGYDFENNYPPLPAPPPPMYRECAPPYRDYESYHKSQGNPNFFNAQGPYRPAAQVAFKRSNTPTKQCQCRNCMQPPNNPNNPNNRY